MIYNSSTKVQQKNEIRKKKTQKFTSGGIRRRWWWGHRDRDKRRSRAARREGDRASARVVGCRRRGGPCGRNPFERACRRRRGLCPQGNRNRPSRACDRGWGGFLMME